jgi:hypothetical protein
MKLESIFPEHPRPDVKIYAYSDNNPNYKGLLKIGMTERSVEERIKEQYGTLRPFGIPYKIHLIESAIRNDGSSFRDKDVHKLLIQNGFQNPGGEWFECKLSDVKSAISSLRSGHAFSASRTETYKMRPEQEEAVRKTRGYFETEKASRPNVPAHFLWNAKMRFGKTFATYQLARQMKWKRLLVVTFKPAVQASWEEDLSRHVDFDKWKFVTNVETKSYAENDVTVCFVSFQDLLGKTKNGGVKVKNKEIHRVNWDCVVFDEYHYGAWRDSSQDLFEGESKAEVSELLGKDIEIFDKNTFPIKSDHFLYLSGTPFRALQSGEFIEEQIFNWTYSDEQSAKRNWIGNNNPYTLMPTMALLTYQMPEALTSIAQKGEFDEFDLNEFFNADGEGSEARFKHQDSVQSWLNIIRGMELSSFYDNLRSGNRTTVFPFSQTELLSALQHTFWFMPSIASCNAMANLLQQKQNKFFHDYEIIVAAGTRAGLGVKALRPVLTAMGNPIKTKSITLSCGKLTTGVSVKPWSGIFMLRNLTTPETYFQAAFRVQTPWYMTNPSGNDPNDILNLKPTCYVFDFAPSRALSQIMDYSCRLNTDLISPEKKVDDFIKFLPILAFDGSSMLPVNAEQLLDIAMSGTSATLLAKRWEHPSLVNVDNETLQRILENPEALSALQNIEGFRSLNEDITTIISKTSNISKAQTTDEGDDDGDDDLDIRKEKKEIDSLRKQIQKKLIKFATRIPIFMYLTDYREQTLQDVITKLEPDLFLKVTGLTIADFELLVSLDVFNSSLMNDAVYKFKRYEDSSLEYLNPRNAHQNVGLWSTIVEKDF